MIDVSNLVVKTCKNATSNHPEFVYYSDYVAVVESKYAITVYEYKNEIDRRGMDSDGIEHFANVGFEISVYTPNDGEGQILAKEIFTQINDALVRLNFIRTFKSELPNADRSMYRYQGRFEATVSEDIGKDGNIINYVYRR